MSLDRVLGSEVVIRKGRAKLFPLACGERTFAILLIGFQQLRAGFFALGCNCQKAS